ncbi:MAG: PilZ domain-containing protein [Planctomycetota bacterium]|nr:MAG: PilZ domain-containing protein [Planctomycetota bacterium]
MIGKHGSEYGGLTLRDRRAYRRMGFTSPVRWSYDGVDRYGRARDLSECDAGFTVRALNAPQVGDKIRLVFELTDDHEWVVDEGAEVRRCDKGEADLFHVGVRFSPLTVD